MESRMYLLAFIWGGLWASFLQFNHFGQFLAGKRTWFTVVVGIGIDLVLLLPLVPLRFWLKILTIIGLSSVFIIFRSLSNELREILEAMHVIRTN